MRKFHSLKIAEIARETPDAVSILFDLPDELAEDYAYVQGQHVTLKATVDGEELRRSYSVCSGVQDQELRIAVKKIKDGRFSGFANDVLKAGDAIDVFPPTGGFHTPLDPAQAKSYVAFSGGSGITPIISLIRTTLHVEPESNFTLVYGNRDARSVIFAEALGRLKDKYMDRFALYHLLEGEAQDTELFQGLLTREKCDLLLSGLIQPETVDAFFICGPGPMMDAVEESLEAKGIDKAKIHIERFINASEADNLAPRAAPAKGDKKAAPAAEVTVVIDGERTSFEYREGQSSLLASAIEAGLEVPYSCTGGVCATCRAKVLEGSVEMRENYGLEPDEVEKGYVLTCQSSPTTAKLVLSYDE